MFVRPYLWAATLLWQQIDNKRINQGLENFAMSFDAVSIIMRRWTTGRLSTYLIAFLLGLVGAPRPFRGQGHPLVKEMVQ